MRILVQFPTYGRKRQFLDCIKGYVDHASGNHDIVFNINCDIDDPEMEKGNVEEELRAIFIGQVSCVVYLNYDKNTTKISSMNAHTEDKEFDIIIGMSDDMIVQALWWDDIIVENMEKYFPEYDGCISFDDGLNKTGLVTLSIMGHKLYEHFGYIYHPDYKSLYCDDEFTQSVTSLGRLKFINSCIIKHEHYAERGNRNSGMYDPAAEKTLSFVARDQQVFKARAGAGFPKERITND